MKAETNSVCLKTGTILFFLAMTCLAAKAFAVEENPDACDCDTIVLSDWEETHGCFDAVKRRTCPLYRDAIIWKERMQQNQQQRSIERRMEPRYTPVR